jgi:predicted Zn-dependent protease
MTKRLLLPILIMAAALSGCDTLARLKDEATSTVVDFIPRTVDKKVGELASLQAEATMDGVPSDAHAQLSELVAPLLRVAEVPGLKPTFRVVNSTMPNAFAFPNGSIFFTTKLLEIAQTPEEILAVAGHELAHVTERHSMQQLVTRATFTVVLNFVVGDVAGLADLLNTGSSLLNLKFSRDHEREADAVGVEFLAKAQLPHRGAAEFFQRMKEFEESKTATQETMQYLSFLATHPQTEERVTWAKSLPPDAHIKVPKAQRQAFENLKKLFPAKPQVPAAK